MKRILYVLLFASAASAANAELVAQYGRGASTDEGLGINWIVKATHGLSGASWTVPTYGLGAHLAPEWLVNDFKNADEYWLDFEPMTAYQRPPCCIPPLKVINLINRSNSPFYLFEYAAPDFQRGEIQSVVLNVIYFELNDAFFARVELYNHLIVPEPSWIVFLATTIIFMNAIFSRVR